MLIILSIKLTMFRVQIKKLIFSLLTPRRINFNLPVHPLTSIEAKIFFYQSDQGPQRPLCSLGHWFPSLTTLPNVCCIQRVTHITVDKVTHITLYVWYLWKKYCYFLKFIIWFLFLDVLCPTYHGFVDFDAFNSEKFVNYKYRYKKTHSEGDTHNAEFRWS